MKKNYFLALIAIALLSFSVNGQNLVSNGNLESWSSGIPDGWDHVENITQESLIVKTGDYSARHQSASGTQDFGHETITGITAGGSYILSYYYFDNDPNAKTRIWSKWQDSNGSTVGDVIESEYSIDNPDWQHYNETFIAPAGATQFYLEVRVYKEAMEGGYVYYDDFSLVSDQTVYPEPSNYPTNFTAASSGLSIDLTWSDAVGAQLPSAYVILGEKTGKGSFEVPVDGIPIENDLDWSDNSVAINVSYGEESYMFSNLASNGTYSFVIYPYTNTGSDIDYKTDGTAPTAEGQTSNISAINIETFDNDLGNWWQYNVTGEHVWEWASYGNPPGCAKGNGYSGGAVENEDWLISPELDMEGYTNITLNFEHARNYASNEGLEVVISTNYDGLSDPYTATWVLLTDEFTFPDPGSWDFIDAGTADISQYASDNTYVAFIYNSTDSEASTWEIDNINIYGVIGTGLTTSQVNNYEVYPNPATNFIVVDNKDNCDINIMNIAGQTIMSVKGAEGKQTINIENLNSGYYIIKSEAVNGLRYIGKFTVK